MSSIRYSVLVGFIALLAGGAWSDAPDARSEQIKETIVKIYTIHSRPDYYNPWSMLGHRSSTGSGAIIKGRRILTNAHVVEDQTFVQVRRYGQARKYRARVLSVSHEADLALLTVDDPAFFKGVTPLELDGLPRVQQEVVVYGFPLGGDTLSNTKGVISRIEHQLYTHSSCYFLAGQIDAAINPGNSGGPVIRDDRIVGVVMQSMNQADNIGYMVPVPVIRHFLNDIEDGQYNGFPSMGVVLQNMENPDMKDFYKLGQDRTGMLITHVIHDAAAMDVLQPGDVLLSIEGHEVADDGTVEFRDRERTSLSYFVQRHQVGDDLPIEILRDGERMAKTLTLHRSLEHDWLVPMEQYDVLPSYYIYGGLVFCPVSKNLLRRWGNSWYNRAPKELVALLSFNYPGDEKDEIIIILKVLASDVNEGYHSMDYWMVDEVNDQPIRNLRDLVDLVEADTNTQYVTFRNPAGQCIVLDKQRVEEAQQDILETYRIKADRSPDLALPNDHGVEDE
jgi:S1-C subfamily serine protease